MQDLSFLDKVKDKILLIGPGASLKDLDPAIIEKTPSLYFGCSFHWFEKNNVFPTYWTFFDPNTITYFDSLVNGLSDYDKHNVSRYDYNNFIAYINNIPMYGENFLASLKNSTTLIYNDLQESKTFYDIGFTTSRGRNWFEGSYKNDVLPRVKSYFTSTIKFAQDVRNLESNEDSLNFSPDLNLVPLINPPIDKFSCYVIPLVIALCPELKHIECIGFGDFDNYRLSHTSGGSKEYNSYKLSFDSQKSTLIKLIKHKNITMSFYNKTSYYKELEGMDKITFCIPSKTNLRYLKTCIPSVRKNAFRDDHDIIVFVDQDEDGTVEWLNKVSEEYNVKVLVNPNLGKSLYGIGRAYDKCIEEATTEIVMVFHADMMLGKHADKKAFDLLEPKTAVCSTRVEPPLHPNNGEKIIRDFGMWPEEFESEAFDQFVEFQLNEVKFSEGIFAPWMVYKDEFLAIGGHDPILKSCREDSDVFNRMMLAGFTFKQPWNSLVYHFTGRGAGSFSGDKERHQAWQQEMNNSTREFIRKWGCGVLHTNLMKPIIPPKFNIGLRLFNTNLEILHHLEPWFDNIYVDAPIIEEYIDKEQKNTAYDLKERVLLDSDLCKNDIIVRLDAKKLDQETFGYIQQLSQILEQHNETGKFELGALTIEVNSLEEYQNQLIFIDNNK